MEGGGWLTCPMSGGLLIKNWETSVDFCGKLGQYVSPEKIKELLRSEKENLFWRLTGCSKFRALAAEIGGEEM